ncbi:MAG: DUF308 domain-containing protein [Clostridiales bacterium]
MNLSEVRPQLNYQLILNILLLLLGIVLLIFPTNGLGFITWIIGIALCGVGVVCGVIFAVNRKNPSIPLIIVAAIGVISGIFVMVFRFQVSMIILPVAIGTWVIASAVLCIMAAISYKKVGAPLWWLPLIATLVALVVAFLIFTNLSSTAKLLAYIIAIYFIVFSGIRIGEYFTLHKYL